MAEYRRDQELPHAAEYDRPTLASSCGPAERGTSIAANRQVLVVEESMSSFNRGFFALACALRPGLQNLSRRSRPGPRNHRPDLSSRPVLARVRPLRQRASLDGAGRRSPG